MDQVKEEATVSPDIPKVEPKKIDKVINFFIAILHNLFLGLEIISR